MSSSIVLFNKVAVTASENSPSGELPARDVALAVVAKNVSGTSPTFDVKVQESPDSISVADASATWFDLVTFTQLTAAGSEKKTVTVPHFRRVRVVVTVGGTTPSADLQVIAEMLPVGL